MFHSQQKTHFRKLLAVVTAGVCLAVTSSCSTIAAPLGAVAEKVADRIIVGYCPDEPGYAAAKEKYIDAPQRINDCVIRESGYRLCPPLTQSPRTDSDEDDVPK